MNGFDDKSGFKTEGSKSDNRALEDDVELLEEHGGSNLGTKFLDIKLFKPPVKKPPVEKPPKSPVGTLPKPPVGTSSKPPVGTPPKPPVGTPPKPPVGTPPKPPVGTPPKPPVGTPPKPPVGTPPKPPVGTPPKPPVGTPPKPPAVKPPNLTATAPASGGSNTFNDLARSVLESFVAPVAVAYTVNKLTGERSLVHPQGSQPNANGSVSYPDGSVALTDGSVKHPDGGVTKPDGLYVYANGNTFNNTTGVFTFADGVSVQAVKNSSGQWEFPDLRATEAGKDDAPPESSARELYTYENGDTFDHDTGVFTYLQGTSVQYVRNSSGEWVAPDSK
jgi:hypothetical protein